MLQSKQPVPAAVGASPLTIVFAGSSPAAVGCSLAPAVRV
uniref:Uncharacterized protein n=1 Tax=Arundo donax TaxID=35708 RepID=A0A0A9FTR0_ARUDO